MIKYALPKNYYIRQLDSRNWIVAIMKKPKDKAEYEDIKGYFPELNYAWYYAVRNLFPLLAKSNKELYSLIKELEDLSSPRETISKIDELSTRTPKTPSAAS